MPDAPGSKQNAAWQGEHTSWCARAQAVGRGAQKTHCSSRIPTGVNRTGSRSRGERGQCGNSLLAQTLLGQDAGMPSAISLGPWALESLLKHVGHEDLTVSRQPGPAAAAPTIPFFLGIKIWVFPCSGFNSSGYTDQDNPSSP